MDLLKIYNTDIKTNELQEIKEFEKARSKHIESSGYEELSDFQPEYKTMYKRKHKSWLYAEAGFEYFSVT